MKGFLFLFIMITSLYSDRLGKVDGVTMDLPLPNLTISQFIDLSIGHIPEAIIKDGLPFFGAKRGDFLGKNRLHKGYDIYINHTDVLAVAAGRVKKIGYGKRSGIYIKLIHKKALETLYIHLTSVKVKGGEWVKKGQILGCIDGAAGNAIAPQLHFEIKRDGVHLDPLIFIKRYYHDNILLQNKIAEYEAVMKEVVAKRDYLVREYLKRH